MIKEVFLNLDRCVDKRKDMINKFPNAIRVKAVDGREQTPESIAPFKVDRAWRDPSSGRRITQGEVGCAMSHIKAWKLCTVLDEPIIVLEDDVEVLNSNYQELVNKYSHYDFLYLGYKDMQGDCEVINIELKKPKFTYWMCSYYITPKVAQALIDYYLNNPLIPADEAGPAVLGIHRDSALNQNLGFKVASFINPLMEPFKGAFEVSETEKSPLWNDFDFRIVSCGTDETRMEKNLPDIDVNIGKGVSWRGGTMQGPGGGQKINLMKQYLSSVSDDCIIMFIDGYDTFIAATREEILNRYLGFDREIVFSAEKTCWPDTSIAAQFPESHTEFRYLNSGTYIGTAKALKKLFSAPIEDHEDDQLYMQREFLSNKHDIVLDVESYLFLCLADAENDAAIGSNFIVNKATRCTTCVIHGNGGENTKEVFDALYKKWNNLNVTPLDKDIVCIPGLFTKEWCQSLIEACERQGNWHQLPNDIVPGQEIRLNTLNDKSFKRDFYTEYENVVKPALEKYWPKLKAPKIRDLFVIKYLANHQISLPLHHDMSMISAAIKLNDEYTGGLLNFPRQKTTNESLEIGDGVFWPAQVTHPHESLPLESGVKYSLVLWTARTEDEGEFYES